MSQQPSSKMIFWRFIDPRSLKGQLGFALTFAVLALTIISVLIYYQSNSVLQVKAEIEEKGTRINLMLATISSQLNAAIASNNTYIITRDSSFLEKRNSNWHEEEGVFHYLNTLKGISKDRDTLRLQLDSLETRLRDVEQAQYRLIQQIGKQISISQKLKQTVNKDSSQLLLKYMEEESQQQGELVRYFNRVEKPKINAVKELIRKMIVRELAKLEYGLARVDRGINRLIIIVLSIALLSFITFLVLGRLFFRQLSTSLSSILQLINKLAKGDLPKDLPRLQAENELNQVVLATQELTDNLRNASEFALNIGEGQLNSNFSPKSQEDVLGNALIQMRNRLEEVAREDEKRDWVTQGLASFAELLREQHQNFKSFGNLVISHLVRYLNATQGGIFIANKVSDQEIYLELSGCYAYDREKYMRRRILVAGNMAEGLLGQVYLEQKRHYLQDIPKEHLSISSGLGDGSPPYLLIVPLKLNEQVEGVLEIASFQAFEDHHIEFIERLSESIAATITTVKTNHQTRQLLEETQAQTSQLMAQEEEMRQNNEELAATQEEMRRRGIQLEQLLEEAKQKEQEREDALRLAEENARLTKSQSQELQQTQEKLSANQKILEKALKKARAKEQELRASNHATMEQVQKAEAQAKELAQVKAKLENNHNILKTALDKSKQKYKDYREAQKNIKLLKEEGISQMIDDIDMGALLFYSAEKYRANALFREMFGLTNTPEIKEIQLSDKEITADFEKEVLAKVLEGKRIDKVLEVKIAKQTQTLRLVGAQIKNDNQKAALILFTKTNETE